ncbi:MAG: GNAT family N-acetyltransferase, partial [Rikenellaceae bacterium]|nr:GNAT family N-acetyltransferase [Rikenellaceae bacterium]
WWIQSVYVAPLFRGRGIYRAMYHYVLTQAQSEGISQVRLYVDKNNTTAQRVYQKLGMTECHYLLYETGVK